MKAFEPDTPFWKGSLHMHTTRSDGVLTPREVAKLYRDAGYDFINITDHWKCEDDASLSAGLLVLTGIEIDYHLPNQAVHLIGVGLDPAKARFSRVEFRSRQIQDGIDALRAAGGVVALAHPAWSLNTSELAASLKNLFALEVFNSVSGVPWNAQRQDSGYLVDLLGTQGTRLPLIAVDDSHFYNGEHHKGFVMVQAKACTREALVTAMIAGRFYASQGPVIEQVEWDSKQMVVTTQPAARAVFYSDAVYDQERVVEQNGGTEWVYNRKPMLEEKFIRCEIYDKDGRRAWTNPAIWMTK
ncbi:phosphotransferase [Clostridia bacterium]|nr:phosphotransferase [Clostridia bacterium]